MDAVSVDDVQLSLESAVPSWKRALDVTLICVAAPLWLPIALLIGLYIKLVSPGPVLFKQARIGLNGSTFMCLKFRTMKVNASTTSHKAYLAELMASNKPMIKLDAKGDPRLIPGGWLLRATGLDELPQLLNVLRGEMSLVGPRPCIPYEYEQFTPYDRQRCATLPGLTGLWQVSGKNQTTFEEMINFDITYAREKSLLMDLKIMALTPAALVAQVWQTKVSRRVPSRSSSPRVLVPSRSC